ncbi:MAG: hypothetical protein KDJ75_01840 [Alphaproteobacteria bacterium]|nr:hypothetical protein [Alphaproteobacteria bacterium]
MSSDIKQKLSLVRCASTPAPSNKISYVVEQDKKGHPLLRFPPYNSAQHSLKNIVETALRYSQKTCEPVMLRLDIPVSNNTLYKIERTVDAKNPPSPGSLEKNIQDWISLVGTVAQEIEKMMENVKTRLQEANQKRRKEPRLPEAVVTACKALHEMGREDVAEALKTFMKKVMEERVKFHLFKNNPYFEAELGEFAERFVREPDMICLDYTVPDSTREEKYPETTDTKIKIIQKPFRMVSANRYNAGINSLREKWLGDAKSSYNIGGKTVLDINKLFNAVLEAHDRHARRSTGAHVISLPLKNPAL